MIVESKNEMLQQQWMTVNEVLRYCAASRSTIYRWCRQGVLEARKVNGKWEVKHFSKD